MHPIEAELVKWLPRLNGLAAIISMPTIARAGPRASCKARAPPHTIVFYKVHANTRCHVPSVHGCATAIVLRPKPDLPKG
jgi:hypothetical protein